MKTFRTRGGPFTERPHFELREIEETCTTELRKVGLYPLTQEAVRIDRFIEKRFNISPRYEQLSEGVLGFTRFEGGRVAEIVVSQALDDEGTKVAERRLRSTLAHEAGHGLLHAYLFALGEKPKGLFDDGDHTPRILCRGATEGGAGMSSKPKVHWSEFQANRAIGAFLMPRSLVDQALQEFCVEAGALGQRTLPADKRDAAIRALSNIFDVNPIVARLRIDEVFPQKNDRQLLL
jgi:hypothetical protein